MSAEAQTALVTKLGALLEECGLKDVSVDVTRETVCPVGANAVEDNFSLSIEGKCPMIQKEGVDKFNAAYKSIMEGVEENSYKISVAACPGAGDPYTTIEKVNTMEDGKEVNLEHVKGQVWLVDFWATWCPPCQRPMAHNQEMLEKNGEAWKDKIRIIGVSIDKDRETLKKHVETKKWTAVEHFHRAGSNCSDVYQVRGVPHVMLIDTEGKIVFKGHPANRKDLEQDMKDLSEGKKLSGSEDEAPKAMACSAEAAVTESKPQLDQAQVMKEIDEFKEVAAAFQKDEALKEHAKKCPRAFCVMVFESKYKNKKFATDFKNYRVVVGPQENIDALKKTFEEKVRGSFEVVLREQAI